MTVIGQSHVDMARKLLTGGDIAHSKLTMIGENVDAGVHDCLLLTTKCCILID